VDGEQLIPLNSSVWGRQLSPGDSPSHRLLLIVLDPRVLPKFCAWFAL
jgi:hypothetical protein